MNFKFVLLLLLKMVQWLRRWTIVLKDFQFLCSLAIHIIVINTIL